MSRILKRPMFKKGGLSEETGIMSGLDSPRRNYAQGSYAPRVNYAEGTPYLQKIKDLYSKLGTKTTKLKDLYSRLGTNTLQGVRGPGFTMSPTYTGTSLPVPYSKPPLLSERGLIELAKKAGTKGAGILSSLKGNFPTVSKILSSPKATGLGAAITQYQMTKPEDYEKDYGISQIEKSLLSNIPGSQLYRQSLAKMAADKKSETETTKKLIEGEDSLNQEGGENKLKGDMESDLMKAYKEYAPIFEKELGVSSDDTKKQLYMQLAKFGAGLAAQPGGDLVGAIGKAAEKPLEGAGETVKDVSTAKRQAKLLALQTAISEGKPGTIGQAIKDIAKIYNVSDEKAAEIYEKWNTNNSTSKAQDAKSYREFAASKNVNPYGFETNIKKLLAGDNADLVGKFNKKLPMDDGAPDLDELVDKEYYIGEGGELYRYDESTDPPELLTPDQDGFNDSKKEK